MEIVKVRLKALIDGSAWLLIAIGVIGIALTNWRLALTLFQFSLVTCVLAGVAIVVSRVVFPQIDLTAMVKQGGATPLGAAIITLSVVLFCVALILVGALVGVGG